MSNLIVNGIGGTYVYSSADLYRYLGNVQMTNQDLKSAFQDFGITPTGNASYDLQKLDKAIYEEYSAQVKNQIANQNGQQNVPWASVCEQIGVPVTGDKNTDYTAFSEAVKLLSQSVMDGQRQAFLASVKSEGQSVFGQTIKIEDLPKESFTNYLQNYSW